MISTGKKAQPTITLHSYLVGFVLSVLLTFCAFGVVLGHVFTNKNITIFCVLICAAIQMIVHLHYYLHLTSTAEKGWTLLSLLFTSMLLVIMLSGSVWVMYHLNHNMMPGMEAM